MKRLACLALPLLLCACGATRIRPDEATSANWQDLRVKVQARSPEETAQLRDELKRTGLFGSFVQPGSGEAPADLVISAVDEKVIGKTTGPLCLDYALSYLTVGIIPEICDQRYQVDIDVTAPATGRAAQFRAELTQRRFIGLFGAITSMFGDWRFFGPQPGNPVLARGALLDQKPQIDALLK
ncbi:MAG: hypothetical protein OSA97_04865 [Nevskia sp.]|nr:hypothetical protein [Nevskia sp.]